MLAQEVTNDNAKKSYVDLTDQSLDLPPQDSTCIHARQKSERKENYHRSTRMIVEAAVRFNPTPPALEDVRFQKGRFRQLQRDQQDPCVSVFLKDFNRFRSLALAHGAIKPKISYPLKGLA